MWFTWIGNIVISLVQFFSKKFTFSNASFFVLIPIYMFYVPFLMLLWTLFSSIVVSLTNTLFNLLDMIRAGNSSSAFSPFFYLLDALGISDSLEIGVSLMVTSLLTILTFKTVLAFSDTTKTLIDLVRGVAR